jgi:3-hydroxyisobutyrate dehydrogenase-like beta-hydroxyacid dehydrogenase
VNVGLLHPGEMGSAVAEQLRSRGIPLLWASEGRSRETARRAATFEDVGTPDALAARSDVILSICPPHAAREVAGSVAGFEGVYVDANAVAPATAREVLELFEHGVDGGIVGGPSAPRLYLSGEDAPAVAELFAGTAVEPRVVSDVIGAASAVKVTFAAWTKGTAAMLLDILELARVEGVEDTLLAEWEESLPDLLPRLESARSSAERKGWRWVGEMEEIADAFAAHDLPDGFHRAAAEVYRWPQGVRS